METSRFPDGKCVNMCQQINDENALNMSSALSEHVGLTGAALLCWVFQQLRQLGFRILGGGGHELSPLLNGVSWHQVSNASECLAELFPTLGRNDQTLGYNML